jgi:hypothetical protein
MKPKIVYNGIDDKGRMRKSLFLDGYEYLLIEPKDRNRVRSDMRYPNFGNTGMALCGVRKAEE